MKIRVIDKDQHEVLVLDEATGRPAELAQRALDVLAATRRKQRVVGLTIEVGEHRYEVVQQLAVRPLNEH
jgi:hypothetical protein